MLNSAVVREDDKVILHNVTWCYTASMVLKGTKNPNSHPGLLALYRKRFYIRLANTLGGFRSVFIHCESNLSM